MHENDKFKMSVSLYEMTRVILVQLVIKIMAACALLNVMRVQKSPRDRKYFKLSLLIKQTESLKMILLKDSRVLLMRLYIFLKCVMYQVSVNEQLSLCIAVVCTNWTNCFYFYFRFLKNGFLNNKFVVYILVVYILVYILVLTHE